VSWSVRASRPAAGAAALSAEKGAVSSVAKTILAVDDERSIVRLVQVNLERQGYNVLTAADGREALDQIAKHRPDMVICDVMMPYMDGLEVLRHLRQDPATRELPVIMLTARAQDQDVFVAYRGGATCYLTKPFNPPELISFVRRIFATEMQDPTGRYIL
jgi:two-component system alkaline phosphatase synthesis response regulator PhoP/two-component system response regulator VicR